MQPTASTAQSNSPGVRSLASAGAALARTATTVFLVDDHASVRRGIRMLLALEPDLVAVGEADGTQDALEGIALLQPDVAVVDLTLKEGCGMDLIAELRNRFPKVKVLVFSMHNDAVYVARALKAGAHAYVPKEEGPQTIVRVIRSLQQSEGPVENSPGLS